MPFFTQTLSGHFNLLTAVIYSELIIFAFSIIMATEIVIRRVSPGDGDIINILAKHHTKAFGESYGRGVEERIKEMKVHSLRDPESKIVPMTLIALLNGELAGSCRICEDDFDGARPNLTPWLATLFVLPEYRGKVL